ncbi:MAG: S1 family peptidase [Dermatophilaceae bacterium]
MDTQTEDLFAAMQRDLGLTRDQAVRRFADEAAATRLAERLQPEVGADFGGAWLNEVTGGLTVAVTTAAAADKVRAAGADARLVRYSLADLQAVKTELDGIQRAEPARMTDAISWGVDPQRNAMVVTARTGRAVQPARELAQRRGDMVLFEESDTVLRTTAYLDGGDPTGDFGQDPHCSAGLNVHRNNQVLNLTAGHCGRPNEAVYSGGLPVGNYVESWYPGNDDALVNVVRLDLWAVGPWVNTYNGDDSAYIVRGPIVNILNGSVCKAGFATKVTCGELKQFGQTVTYPGGDVVYNMTRHTACIKEGDSGGASFTWPSGDGRVSALGVSSGAGNTYVNGVEKCPSELGGTNSSVMQPIADSLAFYQAKLYVG